MSDIPGKRRIAPSTIVAIVAVCTAVALGGATLWQTSHYQTQASIESKMDKLTEAVGDLKVTVAQIGQRLEDHIGVHQ